MKVAVIGSRGLVVENIQEYLPQGISEIVSGGAKGVGSLAREYAKEHGITYTEFLPQYARYGKGAPLLRNLEIVTYADMALALWDGKSKGTKHVIETCKKRKVPLKIVTFSK